MEGDDSRREANSSGSNGSDGPTIERLAGTDELRSAVEQGTIDALLTKWTREASEFQSQSRKYWLY